MKGSDKIEMTINIDGELINLDVNFDEQIEVREAEREVKQYIERMRKAWPENSDRKLLAMAAFQFAKWYRQLIEIDELALTLTKESNSRLEKYLKPESPDYN